MNSLSSGIKAFALLAAHASCTVAGEPPAGNAVNVENSAPSGEAAARNPVADFSNRIIVTPVKLVPIKPERLDSFFVTAMAKENDSRNDKPQQSSVVLLETSPLKKRVSVQVRHGPLVMESAALERVASDLQLERGMLDGANVTIESHSGRAVDIDVMTLNLTALDRDRLRLELGWQDGSLQSEPPRTGTICAELKAGQVVVVGLKYNGSHWLMIVRPRAGALLPNRRSKQS